MVRQKYYAVCKKDHFNSIGQVRYAITKKYSYYISVSSYGTYYQIENPILYDEDRNQPGRLVSIGLLKKAFDEHFTDFNIYQRKEKIKKLNDIEYNKIR